MGGRRQLWYWWLIRCVSLCVASVCYCCRATRERNRREGPFMFKATSTDLCLVLLRVGKLVYLTFPIIGSCNLTLLAHPRHFGLTYAAYIQKACKSCGEREALSLACFASGIPLCLSRKRTLERGVEESPSPALHGEATIHSLA